MNDRVVQVVSNEMIATATYMMVLRLQSDFPTDIRGGQFIHIELPDPSKILRRPFCIADYSVIDSTITIVYAVVGVGTEVLSRVTVGKDLKALFPLGNGFNIPKSARKVAIIGGGLGAAVLPAIPTAWNNAEYYTYLGFGNADRAILVEEMRCKSRELYITTDDGSMGEKGYITDLFNSTVDIIKPDIILACGPEVMFKSLAKVMQGRDIPTFISMEKRMGCGIGACLVCNCKVRSASGEDKFLRACVEGPVFNLSEVVL